MTTLRIEFPDGQAWEVPLQVVADNLTAHYPGEYDEDPPSNSELKDWAQGNMDWHDLEPHAKKVLHPKETDLSQMYAEAELTILP